MILFVKGRVEFASGKSVEIKFSLHCESRFFEILKLIICQQENAFCKA